MSTIVQRIWFITTKRQRKQSRFGPYFVDFMTFAVKVEEQASILIEKHTIESHKRNE